MFKLSTASICKSFGPTVAMGQSPPKHKRFTASAFSIQLRQGKHKNLERAAYAMMTQCGVCVRVYFVLFVLGFGFEKLMQATV